MDAASRFRAAVEAGDVEGALACLSPAVTFSSPVVFRPYEGIDAVSTLLRAVFQTFEDFEYTDQLEGPGVHGLIFRARIGDRTVEGIDVLRPGSDGLIDGFTVMVRPLSAAIALAEAVGARLAASP